MRVAHQLILLVGIAATGVAFAASSASATAPVEVENADTGLHCADDCDLHVVNSTLMDFIRHVPGAGEVTNFQCGAEFAAEIDENGEAVVHNQSITPGSANCGTTIVECRASGVDLPWHLLIEETGPGAEHAVLELCLDFSLGGGAFCRASGDLEFEVAQNPDNTYMFTAHHSTPWIVESNVGTPVGVQATCNGLLADVEFENEWNTEAPNITIIHP